jgi:hypothetical protein
MSKRAARPYPDLARPDAAQPYTGTMPFRVGPNCQPKHGTKDPRAVPGRPEARRAIDGLVPGPALQITEAREIPIKSR